MYSTERHFVTTANTQLQFLVNESDGNLSELEAALVQIKQVAGSVNARAVYRAALLCEDVIGRYGAYSGPDRHTKFQTALSSLQSLVALYTNGLLEIDPEFRAVLYGKEKPVTEEMYLEQLKAANDRAASTLKPLLRLVKDEKRVRALEILSGQNLKLANEVKQAVRFDYLMRHITNKTLRAARASAKNVSISYGADFETIDAGIAPGVQAVLQEVCSEIVHNGLTITGDLEASLNRTWQISVTGELYGQNLTFVLSWYGQAITNLSSTGLNALQGLSGQMINKTECDEMGRSGLNKQSLQLTCPLNNRTGIADHNVLRPLQVGKG